MRKFQTKPSFLKSKLYVTVQTSNAINTKQEAKNKAEL